MKRRKLGDQGPSYGPPRRLTAGPAKRNSGLHKHSSKLVSHGSREAARCSGLATYGFWRAQDSPVSIVVFHQGLGQRHYDKSSSFGLNCLEDASYEELLLGESARMCCLPTRLLLNILPNAVICKKICTGDMDIHFRSHPVPVTLSKILDI
jgi:hypothetical protein